MTPALLDLNRELLIVRHWATIRRTFAEEFMRSFSSDGTQCLDSQQRASYQQERLREIAADATPGQSQAHFGAIKEPSKFRRHCREALAKWILAQKSRETSQECSSSEIHFFPGTSNTYDEQLIRDLSLKCVASSDAEAASLCEAIADFVKVAELGAKCRVAHRTVEAEIAMMREQSSRQRRPLVTGGSISFFQDPCSSASPAELRVKGATAQVNLHWTRGLALPPWYIRLFDSFRVPMGVWKKLEVVYYYYHPPELSTESSELLDEDFVLRGIALLVRYEINLCSGSLQLCADLRLKDFLSSRDFLVMDLCASPINAFMASTGVDSTAVLPNLFCSAFWDTDHHFGSLGNALQFDVVAFAENHGKTSGGTRRIIFTLDVPYDEDFCELVFLKLLRDAERLQERSTQMQKDSPSLHFLLVIPVWWDLHVRHVNRRILRSSNVEEAVAVGSNGTEGTVRNINNEVESLLLRAQSFTTSGYQINFRWPELLEASPWITFDGVFVKDGYEYFCSSSNRVLTCVTATEVLAFEPPQSSQLARLLEEFYVPLRSAGTPVL